MSAVPYSGDELILSAYARELPYSSDELSLQIKILSCKGLLIGDIVSSDPYVKILLGGEVQHKTKYIPRT